MFQGIKSKIRPISYPKKREILVFKAKCQKIFSRIGSFAPELLSWHAVAVQTWTTR